MSASVREESGIFVDFHFSEGGDFEFCSTFLRFQKVGAQDAFQVERVCVKTKSDYHGDRRGRGERRLRLVGGQRLRQGSE